MLGSADDPFRIAGLKSQWLQLGDFSGYGEKKCIVETETHQNIIFFSYRS